ncbi:uncharacterized protein L201_007221 [Kwoniella dendrophila CBS 6074]|uniref:non-specific serine/threonine protein kinase n=1 Tax=Kwoniella dendrophila CBS 6074 TaxID=1295534 RepID=A0AAX4K3T2_9TREE
MTSISQSTSISLSPPIQPVSKITTWPLEHEDIDPSSSSSRPLHLNVPPIASTSTYSRSIPTSRGTKRLNREGSTSPKRKRIREATPIIDDGLVSIPSLGNGNGGEGTSSYQYFDASGPASAYQTTTVEGPNSYAQVQDQERYQVTDTSENGEGEESKSVLFSEQAVGTGKTEPLEEGEEEEDREDEEDGDQYDDLGNQTITMPIEEQFVAEEFVIEGEGQEDGVEGEYDIEEENFEPQYDITHNHNEGNEISSNSRPLTIDLRKVMPPPKGTISHIKSRSASSSRHSATGTVLGNDTMTQVIEGSSSKQLKTSHSFTELNQEAYSDNIEYFQEEGVEGGGGEEEEDTSSPESYHSGDSDEYEMDHRPVLERTAVKRDIRSFTESLTLLREGIDGYLPFKVVDRLGEGTFSSVYLAHDCLHRTYTNEYWSGIPDDEDDDSEEPKEVKVALKKILVTSSPARIENELAILEALRGCRNVSQLISAFREEDQIIIVLPYHRSDDFRHFYKHMDPPHIRSYLQSLFRALKDIHKRGIVHRDVKPANFLYDYETEEGVLVDFGLAERYCPPRKPTCQHAPATLTTLQGSKTKTNETSIVEQAVYDARKRSKQGEGKIGFPHEDKRPTIKTNRAGTRGFRAPEVLLKCPDQTVAIDIWSAGVMLLSILTHKFPVFNSSDDIEALMEIAAIFGRAAMERCALLHNRTIITNVPSVDTHPGSLASLVMRLNPHIYTPHMPNPTPEDAREHIEAIDQVIDLCHKLLRLDATKRLTAAQALRHPFLAPLEGEEDEEEGRDEIIHPTEGKCGDLHDTEDGRHRAYMHPDMRDFAFGQGIPLSRDSLCPEHEHLQQRFQLNPLVTRRWVMQAAEDNDEEQAEEEQNFEEEEGDFVIERPTEVANNTRYSKGTANGNHLKERDINAPYQNGSTINGKRRGALVNDTHKGQTGY